MITKNDCLLLLAELKDKGIDTTSATKQLLVAQGLSKEVLSFINSNRELDLTAFYKKLRHNYNNKKSKLYKEIVQIDEKEPKDIVITLSSLLTQILLFSNTLDNRELFLQHSRAQEITKVLTNYFNTYDTKLCIQLLMLIKADLKVLETL